MEKRVEQKGRIWEAMAARHGVIADIHPLDYVFEFLFNNPSFESREDAVQYYFDDGALSAEKLRDLVVDICGLAERDCSLLEFGAGYGRITRHLVGIFDRARITSCDIHASAVRFVSEIVGVNAALSDSVPESLDLPKTFDVVAALSFFSSLPKVTWSRWLEALWTRVAADGFLIFTTQGLKSVGYYEDVVLDADGFWFDASSEQRDLNPEDYGQTIVHPRYVIKQIFSRTDCELVRFQEGAWWEHQDLYVLRRTK